MPPKGAPSQQIVVRAHNLKPFASLPRALKGALRELSGFQHCAPFFVLCFCFCCRVGNVQKCMVGMFCDVVLVVGVFARLCVCVCVFDVGGFVCVVSAWNWWAIFVVELCSVFWVGDFSFLICVADLCDRCALLMFGCCCFLVVVVILCAHTCGFVLVLDFRS